MNMRRFDDKLTLASVIIGIVYIVALIVMLFAVGCKGNNCPWNCDKDELDTISNESGNEESEENLFFTDATAFQIDDIFELSASLALPLDYSAVIYDDNDIEIGVFFESGVVFLGTVPALPSEYVFCAVLSAGPTAPPDYDGFVECIDFIFVARN